MSGGPETARCCIVCSALPKFRCRFVLMCGECVLLSIGGPLAATKPVDEFFAKPELEGVQPSSSMRETHQLRWGPHQLMGSAAKSMTNVLCTNITERFLSKENRHRNADFQIGPVWWETLRKPKENYEHPHNRKKLKDLDPTYSVSVSKPFLTYRWGSVLNPKTICLHKRLVRSTSVCKSPAAMNLTRDTMSQMPGMVPGSENC